VVARAIAAAALAAKGSARSWAQPRWLDTPDCWRWPAMGRGCAGTPEALPDEERAECVAATCGRCGTSAAGSPRSVRCRRQRSILARAHHTVVVLYCKIKNSNKRAPSGPRALAAEAGRVVTRGGPVVVGGAVVTAGPPCTSKWFLPTSTRSRFRAPAICSALAAGTCCPSRSGATRRPLVRKALGWTARG
jgi:hypothetical protein